MLSILGRERTRKAPACGVPVISGYQAQCAFEQNNLNIAGIHRARHSGMSSRNPHTRHLVYSRLQHAEM